MLKVRDRKIAITGGMGVELWPRKLAIDTLYQKKKETKSVHACEEAVPYAARMVA